MRSVAIALLTLGLGHTTQAWAAPVLYSEELRQGPATAEPGSLVFLPGTGIPTSLANIVIVYQRVSDPNVLPAHPATIPVSSSATLGRFGAISRSDYGVSIRMPPSSAAAGLPQTTPGRTYALWLVQTSAGGASWSNTILINDPRPMWFSPSYQYVSASRPGLPRELKVVGRNLQLLPNLIVKVRLRSPSNTYVMSVLADPSPDTNLEQFVARVLLPPTMATGNYVVELQRDPDLAWVATPGPAFRVWANPAPLGNYHVSNYGCAPNDSSDDRACIVSAISAASAAGGGNVIFAPGDWILTDSGCNPAGVCPPGVDLTRGIKVPLGVNLRGATGGARSSIATSDTWQQQPLGSPYPRRMFQLLGRNIVSGLDFHDGTSHHPKIGRGAAIEIGDAVTAVSDVTVTDCLFKNTYQGIVTSSSLSELVITQNRFQAYFDNIALQPNGNGGSDPSHKHLDQVIVTDNLFEPGAFEDPLTHQGVIGAGFAAGLRLDLSNNDFDGTSTAALLGAHLGWRAGIFLPYGGNHEFELISGNRITCTGRVGDGEAIMYDNNLNTFAFKHAKNVLSSPSPSSQIKVSIAGVDEALQSSAPNFYREHWVQVLAGPGLGQSRKVRGYTIDSATQTVTFSVSPPFDVAPIPGASKIGLSKQAWQVLMIDNEVDNQGCFTGPGTTPNLNGLQYGGIIGFYGNNSDSAIAGNIQREAGGIGVQVEYDDRSTAPGEGCAYAYQYYFSTYFLDIRNNTIEGMVDASASCRRGGINLLYQSLISSETGCAPNTDGACVCANMVFLPSPVVPAFGNRVSHNLISSAFGFWGGGVSFVPLATIVPGSVHFSSTMIDRNSVSASPPYAPSTSLIDQATGLPVSCSEPASEHFGIGLKVGGEPSCAQNNVSLPQHTVLCANSWSTPKPIYDCGASNPLAPVPPLDASFVNCP
jgi:hypothetical protein